MMAGFFGFLEAQYIHSTVDIIFNIFYQTYTKNTLYQILLYYLESIIGSVKPQVEP